MTLFKVQRFARSYRASQKQQRSRPQESSFLNLFLLFMLLINQLAASLRTQKALVCAWFDLEERFSARLVNYRLEGIAFNDIPFCLRMSFERIGPH